MHLTAPPTDCMQFWWTCNANGNGVIKKIPCAGPDSPHRSVEREKWFSGRAIYKLCRTFAHELFCAKARVYRPRLLPEWRANRWCGKLFIFMHMINAKMEQNATTSRLVSLPKKFFYFVAKTLFLFRRFLFSFPSILSLYAAARAFYDKNAWNILRERLQLGLVSLPSDIDAVMQRNLCEGQLTG